MRIGRSAWLISFLLVLAMYPGCEGIAKGDDDDDRALESGSDSDADMDADADGDSDAEMAVDFSEAD